MTQEHTTFIDECIAGTASIDDLPDHIDRWHDGDSELELHEYLGLTWEEYSEWIMTPYALVRVIETRRKAADGTDATAS